MSERELCAAAFSKHRHSDPWRERGSRHIDIAEGRTDDGKLHMFVAVDRTSKFVFVRLEDKANREEVLSDNAIPFIFLPRYMTQMFDRRWRENDIEHRLTKPKHPWCYEGQKTIRGIVFPRDGQVEHMNRTLKEERSVERYYDESHDQLREHLQMFVDADNSAKRLKTYAA